MIDPNTIIVQNNNLPNTINVTNLNEFELTNPYDLSDTKDFARFCKDVEKVVRSSYEYKLFIRYLRENFNMDHCAFLQGVSNEESYDIRIDVHHYPLTLFDIVNIIYRKMSYNKEFISVWTVAEQILKCHYQFIVGLIPLSETVHQLAHAGRLFIPVNKVLGRYKLFVDIYYPFIEPEMLDTLKMIERATYENSEVGDTTILNTNRIQYNVSDKRYQLPQVATITDDMVNRIETIKNNNYILPTVNEVKQIEDIQNKPLRKVLRIVEYLSIV